MDRSKTLLIALLTVTAGAAAFAVAGTAFGQDWYEYKGRLTAGNAYAVAVPAGADALELELVANGAAAAATVALFDAKDAKVAVWKLDAASAKGTFAAPKAGEHVLFVYTLTEGGLSLRVSANEEAEDLSIKRIATDRKDIRLASFEKPGSLAQKFAANLDKEPIFATLLYSGSAENLVAKVASTKGTVLQVDGETGTAYGPGLYGDVSGSRSIFPENLSPGAYTAEATADRFEGDLYLTFVNYLRGKVKAEAPTPPEELPDVDPVNPYAAEIHAGVPTAIQVPHGASLIAFSIPMEEEEEEDESGETRRGGFKDKWSYSHDYCPAGVSVFTPDDRFLGFATFDENMVATLAVDGAGEYVVFVRGGSMPILVETDVPAILNARELEMTTETIELGKAGLLERNLVAEFTLEKAPLGLFWHLGGGLGFSAMANGVFTSELGEAARQHTLVTGPWPTWWDSSEMTFENLIEGDYTFELRHLIGDGEVTGIVVGYDRESVVEVEEK